MLMDIEPLLNKINKKTKNCYYTIRSRHKNLWYINSYFYNAYLDRERLSELYNGYIIEIDEVYYIKSELLNEFIDRILEFYHNNKEFTHKEKDDLSNIVMQFKIFDKYKRIN